MIKPQNPKRFNLSANRPKNQKKRKKNPISNVSCFWINAHRDYINFFPASLLNPMRKSNKSCWENAILPKRWKYTKMNVN